MVAVLSGVAGRVSCLCALRVLPFRLVAWVAVKYYRVMNVGDEILNFLVQHIPAQALADFRVSDGARQRVWSLITQEKESGLLPPKKVELEDFLKLEHLVVLAKAKALAAGHG
jgi:hypothetical protein